MKSLPKLLPALLLGLLLPAVPAFPVDLPETPSRSVFSLETDPATFVFDGYAVHLHFQPVADGPWVIGVGTYALDLPDVMVDLNSKNRNQGWEVRISSAYAVFTEYYFDRAHHGWFAGLQVGVQNYEIQNSRSTGPGSTYRNLLVMPSVGYTWHPLANAFYIKPWAGLGYTQKISGRNVVDGRTYDIAALVPFITLHLGYAF